MVHLSCDYCNMSFDRSASQIKKGKFCSKVCAYAARRKPDNDLAARRNVYRPDHPLATKTGLVLEYRMILYDSIGPGLHFCYWCDAPVKWEVRDGAGTSKESLVVDHIDGNWRNNDLSNIVPSCQPCNGTREKKISDEDDYVVNKKDGSKRRAVWRVCKTCDKPFLIEKSQLNNPKKGQYCSMKCVYNRHKIKDI